MVSRLTGAVVRGLLVALMVLTPALMLPGVRSDTAEVIALIAIIAAALTAIEYASNYPSLVEFRDAPPFNRIRFLSLFITVLLLSIVLKAESAPSPVAGFLVAVGTLIGQVIDFPYSPVRLVVLMLPDGTNGAEVERVRMVAGLCYLISLLSLAIFVISLRFGSWPARTGSFNLWVNLPTFDPTAGGDVVARLNRDARVNVALGFLLPFLIPAVVKAGETLFQPVDFGTDHSLIWTMAAWAFLPSSLFMRGIAMGRVAEMIEERRRRGAQDCVGLVFV